MVKLKRQPIYHKDCIEIPLTKGHSAFVDLDCPPEILRFNWAADVKPHTAYAFRTGSHPTTGRKTTILLHREVMGLQHGDPRQVDHEDRDGLNCRISNLRVCTCRENHANVSSNRGSSSRFRGVYWDKVRCKWYSQLSWRDGQKKLRTKYVGLFLDEEEAAHAWDRAALASGLYDPQFLRLNFPREVAA